MSYSAVCSSQQALLPCDNCCGGKSISLQIYDRRMLMKWLKVSVIKRISQTLVTLAYVKNYFNLCFKVKP